MQETTKKTPRKTHKLCNPIYPLENEANNENLCWFKSNTMTIFTYGKKGKQYNQIFVLGILRVKLTIGLQKDVECFGPNRYTNKNWRKFCQHGSRIFDRADTRHKNLVYQISTKCLQRIVVILLKTHRQNTIRASKDFSPFFSQEHTDRWQIVNTAKTKY